MLYYIASLALVQLDYGRPRVPPYFASIVELPVIAEEREPPYSTVH